MPHAFMTNTEEQSIAIKRKLKGEESSLQNLAQILVFYSCRMNGDLVHGLISYYKIKSLD